MTKNLPENICSLFNDRQKRQIEKNWQGMGGKEKKNAYFSLVGWEISQLKCIRALYGHTPTLSCMRLIPLLNTQLCKIAQFYRLQSKLSVYHRMIIFPNSSFPLFFKFKTVQIYRFCVHFFKGCCNQLIQCRAYI